MENEALRRPEPIKDALSTHWFDAAADGRLLFQRSAGSGEAIFYPRNLAPGTLADDLVWEEASGRGIVYSFTVVHRSANQEFAADCPYVLAIVALEEGVHLTTRIVDIAPDEVRCGMDVEVDFRTLGRGTTTLPVFRPASGR